MARLLRPPSSPDPEDARIGALLHTILLAGFGVTLMAGLLSLALTDDRWVTTRYLVAALPLGALCLESDSPVLGPDRERRNEPANLTYARDFIARVRAMKSQASTDSNSRAVPLAIADTRNATSSLAANAGRGAASSNVTSRASRADPFASSVAAISPVTPPPTTTML